jgi:hypothetical protein
LWLDEGAEMPVRHRRRWPRRALGLAVVIVLFGGVYVGLDLAARSIAESHFTQDIRARSGAKSVSVQVDSLPFLFDLLAHGNVQSVDIRLEQVPVGKLDLAQVDIAARTVQLNRGYLFGSHRIRVTSISSAEVRVTVTASELSAAIHRRVALEGPDTIKVKIGPLMVPATLGIVDGHVLTIGEAGLQLLHVDLGSSPLVPRCAMKLTIASGSATLACTVAPVPLSLLTAISAAK